MGPLMRDVKNKICTGKETLQQVGGCWVVVC